ncbi:MAG: hypothetical protein IJK17_07040 [Lachnospiraceae bacterium]|nr:hypothetical protein [Lachnospiraceae bacterium]
MRRRIWRLSEGQFDDEKPILDIQPEKIEISCNAFEKCEGDFVIRSTNQVPVRGMVYCSNPYILIATPQFDGVESKIHYQVIHQGFYEGDTISGNFDIIGNGCEYHLPFDVHYVRKYPTSSIGEIRELSDFANLANGHWNEAMQLFYSKGFSDFISHQAGNIQLLYRGFLSVPPTSRNLEAFLVACNLKSPVSYTLDTADRYYYSVDENQKESIEITKNTWGYIDIRISCDADFITLENTCITADFFVGSNLSLNYYIHKNRLHAGKNYAVIHFDAAGEHRQIQIVASTKAEEELVPSVSLEAKKTEYELLSLYVAYRLRKITTGDWCNQTIALMSTLNEEIQSNLYFGLIKTHALIANKQRQDALWEIQNLKQDITDKKSTEWAYLLYLCTLIEPEESYVDRLTKEIELIFRERPEDVRIFWFLTFLRKEYVSNTALKLQAISRWVMDGIDSPFLYIEAYDLICRDPFLLQKFDPFSLKILNWARKHDGITGNLAIQITHLLEQEKGFNERIFTIVGQTYQLYPEEELLVAILKYLITAHKVEEVYHSWYALGVDHEIKLTGLFEAFLLSLPKDSIAPLPNAVAMYFGYHNSLPASMKAFLYANIITNKRSQENIYNQYQKTMERFALEQMASGRMDDNLAIIYQDALDHKMIDEDVADAMATLFFTKKIICIYPDITRVMVFEEALAEPIIVPVVNRIAYVPLYTDHYQIFLEEKGNNLITDEHAYFVETLLQGPQLLEKFTSLTREPLHYFVHALTEFEEEFQLSSEDMDHIVEFYNSEWIASNYKHKMYPFFIKFLQAHGQESILNEHLLEEQDYLHLDSKTICFIFELLVLSDEYEKAYEIFSEYNVWNASKKLILRLVTKKLQENLDETNDFLVSVSAALLKQYLSTEETLFYLNYHFAGPTEEMITLWTFAAARQLDTSALEERILTQMLYMDALDERAYQIFESYLEHKNNKMIVEAYLTYLAHKYILEDLDVPEHVFAQIYRMLRRGEKTNDCCRIAMMKHFAYAESLENHEFKLLDELVRDSILKNVYFGFFRRMDDRLVVKYHLYDKVFAEYRGEPRGRLFIRYRKDDGEELREEMIEMYDGIYVRQFMMFFGERITYEIVRENGPTEEVLDKNELSYQDIVENGELSRYLLLNRMQSDFVYQNDKELLTTMKQYQSFDVATEQLFTLL